MITSQDFNAGSNAIEVVGAVQGVATETSQCTAVASGPAEVTASVSGVFDGNATSCGLIALPMAGQPAGEYSVTITFDSPSGKGVSEPVVVSVP